MTSHSPVWRELYRTDDLDDALTVVTTIAAMEFEVRWLSQADEASVDDRRDEPGHFGEPPYIIEVDERDWPDLLGVLDEIRDEQEEFDCCYRQQRAQRDRVLVYLTVALTLAPVAIEVLAAVRGGD